MAAAPPLLQQDWLQYLSASDVALPCASHLVLLAMLALLALLARCPASPMLALLVLLALCQLRPVCRCAFFHRPSLMDLLQAALAANPTYPAILTNLVIQLVFWTLYFELSPSYIWKPLLQGMPFWKRCNGLKTNEGMPLHNEILLGVLLPPFSSRPPPRRRPIHPLTPSLARRPSLPPSIALAQGSWHTGCILATPRTSGGVVRWAI